MADVPRKIEFLDDPIVMYFPFGDFKVTGGKTIIGEDGNEKKLPEQYAYTVQLPEFGIGLDDPRIPLYATEWLHQTMQTAGVGKRVTLKIRYRVNPEDKKKKYWEVVKDGQTTTSLDLDVDKHRAQEAAGEQEQPIAHPEPQQKPPPQQAPPPTQASDPGPAQDPQAAHDDLPLRLMATLDASMTMSRAVMLRHGITTEAEICTSARGLYIDLNRNRWAPKPARITEMAGLLKKPHTASESTFLAQNAARHLDTWIAQGNPLETLKAEMFTHPALAATRPRLEHEWQEASDDELRKAVLYAARQIILKG